MIRPRKNVILSAGLAFALALGTMGCSASVESSTSTEVSTTDENGTTTTTTTESTSGASTEDGVTSETTTQTNVVVDPEGWTSLFIGESDKGYKAFYGQAPDGNNQAIIAVYSPETQEIVSCVGTYEQPEDSTIVVTDAVNGNQFTFFVNDDATGIDLGDEFGTVELTPVSLDEFLDELRAVDVNHVVLAE